MHGRRPVLAGDRRGPGASRAPGSQGGEGRPDWAAGLPPWADNTCETLRLTGVEGRSVRTLMLGKHVLAALLAVSMLVAGGTGTVVAHDNVPVEPGASGSCGADGDGGAFAVHGPGDHENNFAGPDEAQSAARAAVYFARTGGECDSGERYVEVHVISASQNVQYCYSEASDGDDGDTGHSSEPTDDVTAGNGAGEVTINDGSKNYPPGHQENDNDACEYHAHNDTQS